MSSCLCLARLEKLYFSLEYSCAYRKRISRTQPQRFNQRKICAKVLLKHGCTAERKLLVTQVCKLTTHFTCNLVMCPEAACGLSTDTENKSRFNLHVYIYIYTYIFLLCDTETFRQDGVTATW